MDQNQLNATQLGILTAWTDRIAAIVDSAAGDTPFQQPRVGHMIKLLVDILMSNGGVALQCVNNSGVTIAKHKAVYITGYDTTLDCFTIAAAAPTTAIAVGVLEAALVDRGTVSLRNRFLLTGSALDTSGASLGDPVYLAAAGALSLSAPVAGLTQVLGYVHSLSASSSDIAIAVAPVSLVSVASLTADTDGTLAADSDTRVATQKATKTYADTKLPSSYLDTDGALTANSDAKVASQKATKTYADTKLPLTGHKYYQLVDAVGGGAAVTVANATSGFVNDKPVQVSVSAVTNNVYLRKAYCTAGTLTVLFSGAPGAVTVECWQDQR